MSELILEARNISKIYDLGSKTTALNSLSVSFKKGEFTAIAGPSGSGKSTLLNILGLLDKPTHGEVLYESRRISALNAAKAAEFRLRHLGFVFQAYNLIPVLNALENVEYPLILLNMSKSERTRRAKEALASVGLESLAKRRPDHLSGGQQQRVAVARSIVHQPMIVLADEPTANLDSKTAAALLGVMENLNKERGITFLFSSHDPSVLSRAQRIVYLHDGKLAPAHEVV